MGDAFVRLWARIPHKWKVRALLWGAFFAIGFIVRNVWGVDRMLLVVLTVSISAAWLREHAVRRLPLVARGMYKVERWTRDQFWGIIRGMALGVILPTAWESMWGFVREPSASAGLFLALVLLVIGIIYGGIEQVKRSQARVGPT